LQHKTSKKYTVEREFLNHLSTKELLIRIIKSHIDSERKNEHSDEFKHI